MDPILSPNERQEIFKQLEELTKNSDFSKKYREYPRRLTQLQSLVNTVIELNKEEHLGTLDPSLVQLKQRITHLSTAQSDKQKQQALNEALKILAPMAGKSVLEASSSTTNKAANQGTVKVQIKEQKQAAQSTSFWMKAVAFVSVMGTLFAAGTSVFRDDKISSLLSETNEPEKAAKELSNLLDAPFEDPAGKAVVLEAIVKTEYRNPSILQPLYKRPDVQRHLEEKLSNITSLTDALEVLPFMVTLKEKIPAHRLVDYGLKFAENYKSLRDSGFVLREQANAFLDFLTQSPDIPKETRSKIRMLISMDQLKDIKQILSKGSLSERERAEKASVLHNLASAIKRPELEPFAVLEIANWLSTEAIDWGAFHGEVRGILDAAQHILPKEMQPEIKGFSDRYEKTKRDKGIDQILTLLGSDLSVQNKIKISKFIDIKKMSFSDSEILKIANFIADKGRNLGSIDEEVSKFFTSALEKAGQEVKSGIKVAQDVYETKKLLASENLDKEKQALDESILHKDRIPKQLLLGMGELVASLYLKDASLHAEVDQFLDFCLEEIPKKDLPLLQKAIDEQKKERDRKLFVKEFLNSKLFDNNSIFFEPSYQSNLDEILRNHPKSTLKEVLPLIEEVYKKSRSYVWKQPLGSFIDQAKRKLSR